MICTKDAIIKTFSGIASKIKESNISLSGVHDTVSEAYEFDSLNFMNFITAIENKFGIEFEDSVTYEELNNYENLIHLILAKCNCR